MRAATKKRNEGDGLEWATAWLRMTPQWLVSFAEVAWQGASDREEPRPGGIITRF